MCIMHLMIKLFSSYAVKFWFLRFFFVLIQKMYIDACYSASQLFYFIGCLCMNLIQLLNVNVLLMGR